MDSKGLYYELVTTQSLGVDEAVVAGGLGRAISRRYQKRSESGAEDLSFHRQASVHRQQSEEGFQHQPSFKRQFTQKQLSKLQEEWDKDTPKVSILRVMKLNAREWWIILIGVVGAAVNGCIWPAFAFLFGEILEVFALPPDEVLDEIHVWAGLFIVLGVVSGTGVFLKAACFTVSGENLTARLRSLSFRAMLRQEIGWHDDEKNSTGALTTRLANDASQVQGATGTRLGTLIETAFGLSFSLIIALVYSWILTFVILGAVPILVISGLAEATILSGHTKKNKEAIESAGKIAVDSVDNIRTVASLGLENTLFNHYAGEITRPYRRGIINSSVYGLTYAFSQTTIYFMYAAIFRFGAYQVTRPDDDIAHESFEDIFRVFTALIFGAISVGQAGAFAPNYTKARLSSNRIFQLLDRVPLIDGYSVDGDTPDDATGAVETEDLQFKYPTRPDVLVLNSLKLSISPGNTLALVGPSGCGKSTIVSLLERFYDPSKGTMTLDGRDLRDLNIRWLRSQIGIVSQEPVLFDTSVAENIRYGANFREVSDDEVVEAAKAANIHNFVESLPEGYSTNVGSKGTQMSGGQKQRIAIARALIRDPKLLLLDEATSALDTESEKIVQEALDKAREGRTCIVIAHRLSTIYNADHIAVINEGKVIEEGTHVELLGNKGMYYRLNRFQMLGGGAADVGSPAHQSISHDPGQEPM
ncbi:ATP-dependent translocase ABCB1 [Geodia barretti]|nr:ATP-dependent translocase ABCB1 [Geodia barretti]